MPVIYTVLLVLLIVILVFVLILGYMSWRAKLFREIFLRKHPVPKVDRSPVKIDQDTVFGRGRNWFYTTRAEYINVRINSFDNCKLSGYFRPSADRHAKFAVILLHAYDEHPSQMAAYARLMMRQFECHVLITHLRAHQMSGGKHCTYGLYESVDLTRWIEFIKRQTGADTRIFIVGRGIGATAALLAAEQPDFSSNVAGMIIDSPLASLEELLERKGKERYKMNMSFMIKSLDKTSREILHAGIYTCDVTRNANRIRVPVLMFCAADDDVTTPDSIREIYDDLMCQKHMVTVDRAKHLMCYNSAPAAFEREVRKFVEHCVVRLVSIGKM